MDHKSDEVHGIVVQFDNFDAPLGISGWGFICPDVSLSFQVVLHRD